MCVFPYAVLVAIFMQFLMTVDKHNQGLENLEATVNSLIDHQAAMQNSLQDLIQMTVRGLATIEAGFTEMRDGFREVQNKFDQVDARFSEVDTRIDNLDSKLDGLDSKFTSKLDQVDSDIREIKGHLGI